MFSRRKKPDQNPPSPPVQDLQSQKPSLLARSASQKPIPNPRPPEPPRKSTHQAVSLFSPTISTLTGDFDTLEIHTITPKLVQDWSENLETLLRFWREEIKIETKESLIQVYLRCFQPAKPLLKNLIDRIQVNQTDDPSEEEKLFSLLSEKVVFLSALKANQSPYRHYYILWLQFEHLKKTPSAVSQDFIQIIEDFEKDAGDNLDCYVEKDPQIASILGQIYYYEYQTRSVHPKRSDFLQNAREWLGKATVKKDPISAKLFADILCLDADKNVDKYLAIYKAHAIQKHHPTLEIPTLDLSELTPDSLIEEMQGTQTKDITPTKIQIWSEKIATLLQKANNLIKQKIKKSLVNVYVRCFDPAEKAIKKLIEDINVPLIGETEPTEEATLFLRLSMPANMRLKMVQKCDSPYRHYYSLSMQFHTVKEKDSTGLGLVTGFKSMFTDQGLKLLIDSDIRIASILGQLCLYDFNKSPDNRILLQAELYLSQAAQAEEPVAAKYLADILKRKGSKDQADQCLRICEKHKSLNLERPHSNRPQSP